MDPISIAIGGALVVAGFVAGRITRRSGGKPVRAMCECKHSLAMHDKETGLCHGRVEIYRQYADNLFEKCTCRQYVGPTPITEIWTPQILGDIQ